MGKNIGMESWSKRAKPLGKCLVDGCSADLSVCRDYHRRHKVCEAHSKTPIVTIGGREQRFCQQCSRFQSLIEFDEGKRSCRKRLDGHNRRRRKPQPSEPLPRTTGLDFSTQNYTKLVPFDTPHMLGSSSYSWSHETANNQQLNFAGTESSVFRAAIQQGSSFVDPNAATRIVSHVVECDGALSLLSSSPSPRVMDSVGYGVGQYESKASTFHFPEMFEHGPQGSSTHQTLSFMWE